MLPAELPVAAIAPLRSLNMDITYLLRQVADLARMSSDDPDEVAARMGIIDMVINLLVSNPDLPSELLATVEQIAVALFGEDGYAQFLAEKESLDDIAETVRAVASWYAVALGKLVSRWSSSTGGETSKATSSAGTVSTPEPSGAVPALPDGSESAASSS
ncbi:hypothetical protein ACFQHO_53185 [Actinomadura yumaensis]|uniref:hypothetical protein n=1 Tax=Actinomadura yumaensis TaxID=111807 RepID=UPI003621914A